MKELTYKQDQVLQYIKEKIEGGLPFPTLLGIGQEFNYSKITARSHVVALEKKGFLKRCDRKLMLAEMEDPTVFPIVAQISAGTPDETVDVENQYIQFNRRYFSMDSIQAVRVRGNSMLGDSICDGDVALIQLIEEGFRRDDILAVRVEGEGITLKRIKRGSQVISLIPSNPEFSIYEVPEEQVRVVGKLVGIVRKTN